MIIKNKMILKNKNCNLGPIIVKPAYLFILIFSILLPSACASSNKYNKLYNDIQTLYDVNDYKNCAKACSDAISENKDALMLSGNYEIYSKFLEMGADCHSQLGNTHKSVKLLTQITDELKKGLTADHVARIKLKSGLVLKHGGYYSKAEKRFQTIVKEYETIYPDRFAKYARENLSEIESRKVSVVSGTILNMNKKGLADTLIQAFNGFEMSESVSNENGIFQIPIYGSTTDTNLVLYVTRHGYEPAILIIRFNGAQKSEVEPVFMEKADDDEKGFLIGTIFMPVTGGKISKRHGIGKLIKDRILVKKIGDEDSIGKKTTWNSDVIEIWSDKQGIFKKKLSPGVYQVKYKKKSNTIYLEKEGFSFVNLSRGKILVD